MNRFYYFESNIYETEDEVNKAAKDYRIKRIDAIETYANYKLFEETFNDAKKSGCSDADALEIAKYSM